jgi:hypothetical protein
MATQLKRLWKFLNTDLRELVSTETLTGSADAAKDVLELAKTLKEESTNIKLLAPLVGNIETLLDLMFFVELQKQWFSKWSKVGIDQTSHFRLDALHL